ncbi:MAG: phage tail protein [Bacteroidota bacterium]
MSQAGYFPPAAFNFAITVFGQNGPDAEFQEVSGISMELEFEEIAEGGKNGQKYRIPNRTKYPNLVLKRGLVVPGSELANWARETIQDFKSKTLETRDIQVDLMNEDHSEALMSWSFVKALPIKWSISDFNAQQNGLVTETMEFVYDSINFAKF